MKAFARWIKRLLLPEPPPPSPSPEITARAPLSNAADDRAAGPDQEMIELENAVYAESEKNRVAALQSLRVSHVAISAEERSRDMLDELMRSMNRGQQK